MYLPRAAERWSLSVNTEGTSFGFSNVNQLKEKELKQAMKAVILLIISNTFINLPWYGHLKYKSKPLVWAILVSWGIALFEYIFQVPANRLGAEKFNVTQLKVMQECITLVVFTFVAYLLFSEPVRWNTMVS